MQQQWKTSSVVVGIALWATLAVGCAARRVEAPAGFEAAAQQAATAASRAEQASQRAEVAAAKAEASAQRVEQAAQRAEAAALKMGEQLGKRMRK